MKQYFLLTVLIIIISNSFSQNKQIESQTNVNAMESQLGNHYYLDTLWVMDSVLRFQMGESNILVHKNTYKILSRNGLGNKVTSLYKANKDFPGSNISDIYDSIIYFDGEAVEQKFSSIWNEQNNIWLLKSYSEYEHPDLPVDLFDKYYSSSSQQFTSGHRKLFNNSTGKVDTIVNQSFFPSTNTWKNTSKIVFSYDQNKNDTLLLIYGWKNNIWYDSALHRRQFDSGNLKQVNEYIYDSLDLAWSNYKVLYQSFNATGLIDTSYSVLWNDIDNNWVDQSKQIITYDSDDRAINYLTQFYSEESGQLENYFNTIIAYQSDNKFETHQSWDLTYGVWINSTQYYHSYIIDDIIDTIQGNSWNLDTQNWEPNYRDVIRFNFRFNEFDRTRYNYNNSQWEVYSKDDYYWSAFMTNALQEETISPINIYPNPASTHVSFNLQNISIVNEDVNVNIYNISGQKVKSIPIVDNNLYWDCSNENPGLYIYYVIINGVRHTGKIIIKR